MEGAMEDLQDTFIVHTIEEIQVCCRLLTPEGWLPQAPVQTSPLQDCSLGLGIAAKDFLHLNKLHFMYLIRQPMQRYKI